MFQNEHVDALVDIRGSDLRAGGWQPKAYVPPALPDSMPISSPETFVAVGAARAALAAVDATTAQLPDPTMFRMPALRREAQSTSALEGTYAPVAEVLVADEDDPGSGELIEIMNYVRMAVHGYGWIADGRPITLSLLCDLQGLLMHRTPLAAESGRLRDTQVVIGRRPDAELDAAPIHAARFVPPPPGDHLVHGLQQLVDWMCRDHAATVDPVVAAAMSHYQFETLHPFRDGNGRVGRLLIVLYLQQVGVLAEPTLTVSPWFEARRSEYYDHLLGVSTRGDRDSFVGFFALGLRDAAVSTRSQMLRSIDVQSELRAAVRRSALRADSASALVDLAIARPSFTVRTVESELGVSYGRANKLVGQLVDLGVLAVVDPGAYKRRFYAPRVVDVLVGR